MVHSKSNVQHSKKTTKVQCEHDDKIITFESATEVVNWIIENTTQTKASENVIRKSCKSEYKTAYEGKIYFI